MPPWSDERKAAWRAKMAERNNKPASGMPASGPGWGGPANGAGSDRSAAPPIADPKAAAAASHTPEAEAKRQRTIAKAEELKGVLSDIALNDKAPDMARIAAADKLLDRIEGKPTQTINANVRRSAADFTDAELAAIAGEDGGEAGAGEAPHSTH